MTISARAQLNSAFVFTTIFQDETITSAKATYLTIHHPFSQGNPLKVTQPGTLTRLIGADQVGVTARDLFGNIAKGDPVNGQYYTGQVNFQSSGSTATVSLRDTIANTTYHIFTPAEQGSFNNMRLVDLVQEVLMIGVTDYSNMAMTGYTNDVGRIGLPADPTKRSDGDVNLADVVVTPSDFSPESTPPPDGPIPPVKVAFGVTKKVLNQGDGNVASSPYPIPMLRMAMQVTPGAPSPALPAQLSQMRINSRVDGNLNNSHITEVAIYRDNPTTPNGRFDAAVDVFLASGAYSAADGAWFFGNPFFGQERIEQAKPTESTLGQLPSFFFITVRVSSSGYAVGELPASFGLELTNPSYITLSTGSAVAVGLNNFGVRTATSSVQREPAAINVKGTDINAFWQPPALSLSTYPYINQGEANVGIMKFDMWTDVFTAVLSRLRITHTGTGLDRHIKLVKLFQDTQANQSPPGNGVFEFSIDKLVASATFPEGEGRTVTLAINNPSGSNGTIGASTRTYFVAYDFDAAAESGQTHGAIVTQSDVIPLLGNGTVNSFSPVASTQTIISATPDLVKLSDVNRQGLDANLDPIDAIPSKISQNDKNKPVAKLTMKVDTGSAEWTGVKLDRWMASTLNSGTGLYNPLFALNNKAADVTNIRIWRDMDGNGLLNVSSDTQVSPFNATIHNFPQTTLRDPLSSVGVSSLTPVSIAVNSILSLYPADNPFAGDPQQRLVLGDDTIDETKKEVVRCYAVDLASNTYNDCYRAQEGTIGLDFATGTVLSGSARIPVVGLIGGGGQILTTDKQDYFVAYDIDAFASVSPAANIGMIIANTTYLQVKAPKSLSTLNIGIPAVNGGRTVAFGSNVAGSRTWCA